MNLAGAGGTNPAMPATGTKAASPTLTTTTPGETPTGSIRSTDVPPSPTPPEPFNVTGRLAAADDSLINHADDVWEGTVDGAAGGAYVGLFGGPFDEITVPAFIIVGGFAGTAMEVILGTSPFMHSLHSSLGNRIKPISRSGTRESPPPKVSAEHQYFITSFTDLARFARPSAPKGMQPAESPRFRRAEYHIALRRS